MSNYNYVRFVDVRQVVSGVVASTRAAYAAGYRGHLPRTRISATRRGHVDLVPTVSEGTMIDGVFRSYSVVNLYGPRMGGGWNLDDSRDDAAYNDEVDAISEFTRIDDCFCAIGARVLFPGETVPREWGRQNGGYTFDRRINHFLSWHDGKFEVII